MISHKLLVNRNKENVNPDNKTFNKTQKQTGVHVTKKIAPPSFSIKQV
mgnify:CR=1 FL=1